MVSFCHYDTVQYVRIKDKRIFMLYTTLVTAIIGWIVYTVVVPAGHQASCEAVSSRSMKLKGEVYAERTLANNTIERVVFDSSDITTTDSMGFFVATGIRETTQQRGRCAWENGPSCDAANATQVCVSGMGTAKGEGFLTGVCLDEEKRCEVDGWCPGEPQGNEGMLPLVGAENMTVFIRINARFPCVRDRVTGIAKRADNLPGTTLEPGVNLFTIGDLVARGGIEFDDVRDDGADIVLGTSFDCNLGTDMKKCIPSPIKVTRIDTSNSDISRGYNIRRVVSTDGGTFASTRVLQKLVGVRMRVQVSGKGRYFDLITLVTHFGSGLALVGLATVIVDAIVLSMLPLRDGFAKLKYKVIDHVDGGKDAVNSRREPLLATSVFQSDM